MADNPNRLSQFWQELQRRKVVRVITVYAAAAFVILELVSIIVEPLRLPEWTLTLIIILLCIGFIIAVILSWIYDIRPEGGIVKTKAIIEASEETSPSSPKGWKMASYIGLVVITALIVLNIINGIMEEILINLQSIKELRVPGRTSVEQYRNNPKPIPEIAVEMNVAYIVEGSGQRYGNKIRLRVQLVEGATDKHLWADSYDEEIKGAEDIFRIQSQIAESIAAELEAIITPEEKQLIEKIPTTNLTAYDFYRRGREEYFEKWISNLWLDGNYRTAAERAEYLFQKALDIDSTFGQVYIDLARIYFSKHGSEIYYSEGSLDSVLILVNLALSYDNQLAEAYTLKGFYYGAKGKMKQALESFDKAIQLNPNNWEAYRLKGRLYFSSDLVEFINNYHKAASLNRGSELPGLLRSLANAYRQAGFQEKYQKYMYDAFELDDDSIAYYSCLATTEYDLGNDDKYLLFLEKVYALDTTNINQVLNLGLGYLNAGHFKQSLKYLKEYFEKMEALGEVKVESMHRIGYAYWKNGYKKEADYYFDKMIEI